MKAQVLIVGAGPTGLTLAIALLKSGIPVRIINKEASHHVSSRGAGVQPRIQEIEHFLGTLSDLQALSIPHPVVRFYDPANPRLLVKSASMLEPIQETPNFPMTKVLLIGQYLHEHILRTHVEALSGTVELGTEFVGLEQTADGVTVKLCKTIDGERAEESAEFAYVVGADGANSTVRHALGLNFIGETNETLKMAHGDIDLEGLEEVGMHIWGNLSDIRVSLRTTSEPGRYQYTIGGANFHTIAVAYLEADMQGLQEILNKYTGRDDLRIKKIHVKAEWKLNVRMVDRFQMGRVFIAGDAAHAHPPTGGQGMTSGIQDAFNLAWKLSLVLKSHASPRLLDSYESERRPVIEAMLLKANNVYTKVRTEKESGMYRESKLTQLYLNYRWSNIVFDERSSRENRVNRGKENAYGAPGQKKTGKFSAEARNRASPRLFDLFDPTVHTVLVFIRSSSNLAFLKEAMNAVQAIPAGLDLVHPLVIVPAGTSDSLLVEDLGVDLVIEDRAGYAVRGYGLDADDNAVVIVRPDMMIGAVSKKPAGIEEYFITVLGFELMYGFRRYIGRGSRYRTMSE